MLSMALAAFISGCDQHSRVSATKPLSTGKLADHFESVSRIRLEEADTDLIGRIGSFLETRNGDVVLADAIQLRVRRYDRSGGLLAAFGGLGAGPFEFRRIGGMAEDSAGRIVVADPALGRMTLLTADLQPDTFVAFIPRPRGPVFSLGDRLVLATAPADRQTAFTAVSNSWMPEWTIPAPSRAISAYPYWNSYAVSQATTSRHQLFTAYSLLYPILVYDSHGQLRDSIPEKPASFRVARVLAPGAFVGPGAEQRRSEWLGSFDVISSMAVVADSFLVVTHGVLRQAPDRSVIDNEHRRVDVYKLPLIDKVAEDLVLPDGARVLAGGRYLYVLEAEPPDAWTVTRYAVRLQTHP